MGANSSPIESEKVRLVATGNGQKLNRLTLGVSGGFFHSEVGKRMNKRILPKKRKPPRGTNSRRSDEIYRRDFMNWILPKEILMSEQLTWQAVGFILIAYGIGLASFLWLVCKVIKAMAEAVDAWKKR